MKKITYYEYAIIVQIKALISPEANNTSHCWQNGHSEYFKVDISTLIVSVSVMVFLEVI